ncbi:MAG: hypothetical protein LLF94_12050 [Chlamydiales bacterium]|nr:hypothetical protein [Chlamydiales bacterium]
MSVPETVVVPDSFRTRMYNAVENAASKTRDAVKQGFDWTGRKYVQVTNAITPNETVGKIVRAAIQGLPFAVAHLFVPAYIQITAFVAYQAAHVVHYLAGDATASPVSDNFKKNLFTGLSSANLFRAVNETVNLVKKQKTDFVTMGVSLVAALYFSRQAAAFPKAEAPVTTAV